MVEQNGAVELSKLNKEAINKTKQEQSKAVSDKEHDADGPKSVRDDGAVTTEDGSNEERNRENILINKCLKLMTLNRTQTPSTISSSQVRYMN